MKSPAVLALSALLAMAGVSCQSPNSAHIHTTGVAATDAERFTPLFTTDGTPQGWTVRAWNDVKNPPDQPTEWKIVNGVLHGGEPRGSWLMSEREYGDFVATDGFLTPSARRKQVHIRVIGDASPDAVRADNGL